MPKFECLIHREGGSHVECINPIQSYHFKPSDEDPRHIADVEIQTHIDFFLDTPEGYLPIEDAEHSKQALNVVLLGSDTHLAHYALPGDTTISLGDVIRMALRDSELEPNAWNDLDKEDRNAYIDAVLDDLKAFDPNTPPPIKPEPEPEQTSDDDLDPPTTEGEDPQGTETPAEETSDIEIPETAEKVDLSKLKISELTPFYVEKFNRKPSSRMKHSDILRALADDEDDE